MSRPKGSSGRPEQKPKPESKKRVAVLQPQCLEDLEYWVATDRRVAQKVLGLMKMCLRDPFTGLGKPEPLKELGSDVWSRRVTGEDRLVYRVLDDRIDFLQARYHY